MYEKFILLVILWCFSFVVFWNNISNEYQLGVGNSLGLILTVIVLCPISWIMAKLCVDNIETLENSSRSSRYTVKGGQTFSELEFSQDYEREYSITQSIGKMRRNHKLTNMAFSEYVKNIIDNSRVSESSKSFSCPLEPGFNLP